MHGGVKWPPTPSSLGIWQRFEGTNLSAFFSGSTWINRRHIREIHQQDFCPGMPIEKTILTQESYHVPAYLRLSFDFPKNDRFTNTRFFAIHLERVCALVLVFLCLHVFVSLSLCFPPFSCLMEIDRIPEQTERSAVDWIHRPHGQHVITRQGTKKHASTNFRYDTCKRTHRRIHVCMYSCMNTDSKIDEWINVLYEFECIWSAKACVFTHVRACTRANTRSLHAWCWNQGQDCADQTR